jgi:plasmid stabilization system protein ParE
MVGKLFRVVFSRLASRRLREHTDYYQDNASPTVAQKVRQGIRDEAKELEKLPSSRPIYPGTEDMKEEIRYAKKWSFKIIFQVLNPKKIVRILTIRHDAEDPEDVLDELK